MKEFNKWEIKQPCFIQNTSFDNHGPDNGQRRIIQCDSRKEGWKAALEWALGQETDLQSTELGDGIRKELENE